MNDGQLEVKKDFTDDLAEKLPVAESLATTSLPDALELLNALEKTCRIGNDITSLVKVTSKMIALCVAANDVDTLISTLQYISKRRSQKNKAVTVSVQEAMLAAFGNDDDGEGKVEPAMKDLDPEKVKELILALRDITEGKMYLEAERARLTMRIAIIYEKEGKVSEAADIVQEVHVETYGSMSKMEKQEFILEQVRLVLAKKDYVRSYILSQKVNRKLLDEEESYADSKIRFYDLMIRYHRHERNAFEMSKCYMNVFKTPSILSNEKKGAPSWEDSLKATVAFLILSPYDNEQNDMMHRIHSEGKLDELPAFKKMLKRFITQEIILYPFESMELISNLPQVTSACEEDDDKEEGMKYWKESLTQRVLQHNIRVAAKYYTRIRGKRLAAMLELAPSVLEVEISNMVSSGSIYAKIDRPKDIIRFTKESGSDEVLSSWSHDISSLLNMVENTTHLIAKEMMVKGLA